MDDLEAAREAKNWTAVASLQRLCGQGIGSLQDNVRVTDDRMSVDTLIDRIAGTDKALADILRKKLSAKHDDFDA